MNKTEMRSIDIPVRIIASWTRRINTLAEPFIREEHFGIFVNGIGPRIEKYQQKYKRRPILLNAVCMYVYVCLFV